MATNPTNSLGSIQVDLTANVSTFITEMQKSATAARKTGDDIHKSFKNGDTFRGLNNGSMEARHAMMLLGEEAGVHIPRAVAGLITSIGPLGGLLSAAFPIIGAVALLEVIGKLIAKHEAYVKAIIDSSQEIENLTIKEGDHTAQLALSNLKLEDQLAMLENRPARNRLAIALIEARIRADELITALTQDNAKVQDLFEHELGLLSQLEKGIKQAFYQNINETPFYQALLKQIPQAQAAVENLNRARLAASNATGEEAQVKALTDVANAFKTAHDAMAHALELKQLGDPEDVKGVQLLTDKTIEFAHGEAEARLQIDNLRDSVKVANRENVNQGKSMNDALLADMKKHNDEVLTERQRLLNAEKTLAKQEADDLKTALASVGIHEGETGKDMFKMPELVPPPSAVPTLNIDVATAAMDRFKLSTKDQNEELAKLYELDPVRKYQLELDKVNFLYKQGLIDVTTYNAAARSLQEQLTKSTSKGVDELRKDFGALQSNINDMLTGGKVSWDKFFKDIEMGLLKLLESTLWKSLADKVAQSATPGSTSASGVGGGFWSTLLSALPAMAGGGNVSPGRAYIVGENSPELFVPDTAGRIEPNMSGYGGGSSPIINFHGIKDMDSFRRSRSQIGAAIQMDQYSAAQRNG